MLKSVTRYHRDMTRWLTIGEAGRESGLSPDTIRFYERSGILPPAPRQANGYRAYPPEHVESLRLARRLRDLGLPTASIADLVQVVHAGTCRDLREELGGALQNARQRARALREELERSEAQLARIAADVDRVTPADDRLATIEACPCLAALGREE